MVGEQYTFRDSQFAETQFLRDVADAIQNAKNRLTELSDDIDKIDLQDSVKKAAHLEAINFITDNAQRMLTNAFMQAIQDTVEYNHELFITPSMVAIQQHWQDVMSVVPLTPGKVQVDIDFTPLGDIKNYAAAVQQARTALGFKMTTPPESRSIYWARNIYGVDREGARVTTTPAGHEKSKDVTANYLGKWKNTVQTRLTFIEAGTAPWWYILNYGNTDAFGESEGTPYPVVSPTHFIEVLETQVKEIFNQIYSESLQEWETWYADKIADDYGLKKFDDFDAVAKVVEPEIVKQIEKQEKLEPRNTAIGTITQDGKVWDIYISSKGRISKRYSLSKN
jgi:hypothetical protein